MSWFHDKKDRESHEAHLYDGKRTSGSFFQLPSAKTIGGIAIGFVVFGGVIFASAPKAEQQQMLKLFNNLTQNISGGKK